MLSQLRKSWFTAIAARAPCGRKIRFPHFEYAIGVGVDVLELDMAVTKDNVMVVSHDPYLDPPVCSGPQPKATIHELTLAAGSRMGLRQSPEPAVPQADADPGNPDADARRSVRSRAAGTKFSSTSRPRFSRIIPELTPPPEEFVRLVLAMVRKHHLESRVMLQSFDFRTLHAMKKIAPEIRRVALWEGDGIAISFLSRRKPSATIVSPYYQAGDCPKKSRAAHAAGLRWCRGRLNTPADWDKLIEAQVDAIITDDPAELIAYLKGKGMR